MVIIIGPLVDKGHFRKCFHGGSVMLLMSLILTSFCKTWWELFLVQGVWTGTAMGMIFIAVTTNLTTYFHANLGLVSGIAASGSSLGLKHRSGPLFRILADKY